MKLASFLIIFFFFAMTVARAIVNVSINQVASDVVISWNGSLDVSNLSGTIYPFNDGAYIVPSTSAISSETANMLNYGAVFQSVINDFGTAGFTIADSSTGDFVVFQFDNQQNRLVLPASFTSGNISGAMTFEGETLSTLGITDNINFSTTMDLGGGIIEDFSFTTSANVPEPATYPAAFGVCALMLVFLFRRRP